jgi:glycerophosphoryl diester phosphodiesterase|tara:strand:+ start:8642 stop:9445 length:804 start_codon:yes stop_codon:yes gene_type:complete
MIASIILMVFIGLLIKHLFFWSPVSGSRIYKHPHPLFIAHRGLHKTEPENTTASIKKAIKLGFTAIELDVFSSLDKKIICSHNIDLERETEGIGFVDEKKYDELKDITHRTKNNKNKNECMPLISNVLEDFGKGVLLIIDVKTKSLWDISSAINIVKLIKKFKRKKTVIVSSFNPFLILLIKWIDSKILTGFIIKDQSYLRLTNIIHPDFFHPRGDTINDEVLSYAEKKRIPINAWTINNALSWSWLYKKGVKGIITDEIPQFSQKL